MKQPEVGDKVKILKCVLCEQYEGDIETVEIVKSNGEFETDNCGFAEGDEWEIVEEKQNLIIHCPTREGYKKIVDKIGWYDKSDGDIWDYYGEETSVRVEDGNIKCYGTLDYYKNYKGKSHKDYKFTTAKEYLGEERTLNRNWKDACVFPLNEDIFINSTWSGEANGVSKPKKTMSIIKRTFMSKESKAVQELCLGENSKNLNRDGYDEFVSFLYETMKDERKEFLKKLVELNNDNK